MRTSNWEVDAFLDWLREGVTQLGRTNDEIERYRAFAPLRFHPGSSIMGQLAAFLAASGQRGLRISDQVKQAIEVYFRALPASDLNEGEARFVLAMWRLYPAVNAYPDLIPYARLVLRHAEQQPIGDAELEELVYTVAGAASVVAPCQSQFSFFDYLHSRPRLWRHQLVIFVAERYLSQPKSNIGESWKELRFRYGDALRSVTNPNTAMGRAFLRQLARHLLPEEDVDVIPNTPSAARALRDRLSLMDTVDPGSVSDRFPWPQPQSAISYDHLRRLLAA